MLKQIIKRDRTVVPFRKEKIVWAIFKAANAVGGNDFATSEKLADEVVRIAEQKYPDGVAEVEAIQDIVEKVLIEAGHAKTAKAFILYREKRRAARESNALIGATINMFSEYLNDRDWKINENANTQKSINGLNNYIPRGLHQKLLAARGLPRRHTQRPHFGRHPPARSGLFRPLLHGLGPETAFAQRIWRRARQGRVQAAQAPALLPWPNRQLHLHHPGRDRRRAGLVIF